MGSIIELQFGNFEIDWGKNNLFIHHGALFQPVDLRLVPYRYIDQAGKVVVEQKLGYSRSLQAILPRLELLGHTLEGARNAFERLLSFNRFRENLAFENFAAAIKAVDVLKVSPDYDSDHDLGEFFAEEIYSRLGLGRSSSSPKSWLRNIGEILEGYDPWNVLRLFAENPYNLELPVTWHFADVVENGWVDESEIATGLSPARQFLIVTEGSSDARIIKKALDMIRPEVSDFFYFVDMEIGYPFSGTGNLHNFCRGLASIGILNRVLILYDNDAEGVAKCVETQSLSLPRNIRVIRLPDLVDFDSFPTVGPNGQSLENINGRAAAIECYLDLKWRTSEEPEVRWTAFNDKLRCYQGALERKQSYAKDFMELKGTETDYSLDRLRFVLQCIINECVTMSDPESLL